jgi:hypothetical protein
MHSTDAGRYEGRKLGDEVLHNLYSSIVIKYREYEMDGVCSTYGINEKCIQNFSWKTRIKKTT